MEMTAAPGGGDVLESCGEVPRTRPDAALADAFELQRGRLVGMAKRMLGSCADAEDAVQEAWLRLARQEAGTIDNLAGWLTRVVSRVCLDVLRARKARPESPYAEQPPELIATEGDGRVPEDEILLEESVGVGMSVVLDSLSPAERLAFVLHDLFAIPFRDVGEIIGKSGDATKMLASRGRRKAHRTPPPAASGRPSRHVVDAFLAASRCGDFDDLIRVLDPDTTVRRDAASGVGHLLATAHHRASGTAHDATRASTSTTRPSPGVGTRTRSASSCSDTAVWTCSGASVK